MAAAGMRRKMGVHIPTFGDTKKRSEISHIFQLNANSNFVVVVVVFQFSFISVGQKNVRPKYDFWVLKTKNLIEILYLFVACDFVSVVVGWA